MNQKSIISFVVLCLFSFSSYCQIVFEPGYLIDNQGKRSDILIKNQEWLDNPSTFDYKISQSEIIKKAEIDNIREFGISDGVVFLRTTVNVDISSDQPEDFSYNRNPDFEKKTVFLKKLTEGKASLYAFTGESVSRFFYSINGSDIKPLVYKRYVSNGKVLTNNAFKQTLINEFTCGKFREKEIISLKYKKAQLRKLFVDYNNCIGSESIVYAENSQKYSEESKINLTIKAGMRSNKFESSVGRENFTFNNKIGPQLGIEAEFIFKFNRNKWSALLDASYFSYKDDFSRSFGSLSVLERFEIDYSAIELSAGARHSFFILKDSRIFVNVLYVQPINLNQSFTSSFRGGFDDFVNLTNLAVGAGFQYSNVSLEFKLQGSRTLINGKTSKYDNLSIVLGYSFL